MINPPSDSHPHRKTSKTQSENSWPSLSDSVRIRVANLPPPTSIYGTESATGSRLGRLSASPSPSLTNSFPFFSLFLLGILFSGGLDSMVLAALASQHVPPDEPIDLINVSFADSSSSSDFDKVPDRQNGINGYDLSPSFFFFCSSSSPSSLFFLFANVPHSHLSS